MFKARKKKSVSTLTALIWWKKADIYQNPESLLKNKLKRNEEGKKKTTDMGFWCNI